MEDEGIGGPVFLYVCWRGKNFKLRLGSGTLAETYLETCPRNIPGQHSLGECDFLKTICSLNLASVFFVDPQIFGAVRTSDFCWGEFPTT